MTQPNDTPYPQAVIDAGIRALQNRRGPGPDYEELVTEIFAAMWQAFLDTPLEGPTLSQLIEAARELMNRPGPKVTISEPKEQQGS